MQHFNKCMKITSRRGSFSSGFCSPALLTNEKKVYVSDVPTLILPIDFLFVFAACWIVFKRRGIFKVSTNLGKSLISSQQEIATLPTGLIPSWLGGTASTSTPQCELVPH